MNEHDIPPLPALGLEPQDLDGHSIEELSDYLDANRTPRDPAIEESAGCRIALDALERLRGISAQLLEADAAAATPVEDGWVHRVLSGIALDARAGRRIPILDDAGGDLGVTEGAVRGVVRAAERDVPGALVGRCVLEGDVMSPGAPITVKVEVSVAYGAPIPDLVTRLRDAISTRLRAHTELNVVGIDVLVQDLRRPNSPTEETR